MPEEEGGEGAAKNREGEVEGRGERGEGGVLRV